LHVNYGIAKGYNRDKANNIKGFAQKHKKNEINDRIGMNNDMNNLSSEDLSRPKILGASDSVELLQNNSSIKSLDENLSSNLHTQSHEDSIFEEIARPKLPAINAAKSHTRTINSDKGVHLVATEDII